MTDPNLDQLELLAHLERLRDKYGRPGEAPESLVDRLESMQAEIGELLTFERLQLRDEQ